MQKKNNIPTFIGCFLVILFSLNACKQDAGPLSSVPITNQTIQNADTTQIVQLVFTADLHYGITRAFRGAAVDAAVVNQAMVAQMNSLPSAVFPKDNGINAGRTLKFIDYIAVAGDITNREDGSKSPAATISWAKFNTDYLNGITLRKKDSLKTQFLLTCGNHDVSNAIGYPSPLAIDNSSLVNIYNLMLKPFVPKTSMSYNYNTDKPNYSKDMVGVHLMFITMWPDSANRVWMEQDLAKVSATTPVLLFAHDPAAGEPSHFTNPLGNHGMTVDYENEIQETFKGQLVIQRAFASFLKLHPNIKAYFHGHTNNNQFYNFVGPDGDINLNVYRVDSPMKGSVSLGDETKLSFQVLAINGKTKTLTVRECLWNTAGASSKIQWGASSTIALQ